MSDHKLSTLIHTLTVTLAGVAISFAATRVAMNLSGYGPIPIATYLSVGLPAVMVPITTFPLILMYQRQRALGVELKHLVHTDVLTGLPNRRAFFAFAETVMERDVDLDVPTTAMMIDVDHFKAINDAHGHAIGDAVLKRIAEVVRDVVRASKSSEWTVARIGGEEFAVLIDGLVPTAVARLADQICLAVRSVTHPDQDDAKVTVSIGVAFRARDMGIDRLLKLADDAAYSAKSNGRDRWAFGSDRHVPRRMTRPLPLPEPANDRRAFG